MKYVLVTGGVVSGLGKGVTASSIGVILKACGHRVTSIKIGTALLSCQARKEVTQKQPTSQSKIRLSDMAAEKSRLQTLI